MTESKNKQKKTANNNNTSISLITLETSIINLDKMIICILKKTLIMDFRGRNVRKDNFFIIAIIFIFYLPKMYKQFSIFIKIFVM